MASVYTFVLDGYTFPRDEVPMRGPLIEFNKKRFAKQNVIGTSGAPTILTLMGDESPEWQFVSRAKTATKDKILSVYNAAAPVTLKTPQNPTTGFTVVMTELEIQSSEPIEDGRFLCSFKLMRR